MRFASLGSGSKGNATVVQSGTTCVLIDCGFSLRQTERRLDRLGLSAADLDAILVTHEHTDHCSGVGRLSRKYQLPVYLTHGTWSTERCGELHRVEYFYSDEQLTIGELDVMPVAVPHDAREPCQFVLRAGGKALGVLTDLGNITPFVSARYEDCQALLLECNHDPDMLRNGSYPPALKQRVGGDWGHLSNAQAAQFLAPGLGARLQHLVVAHISEKNNSRRCVEGAFADAGIDCAHVVWAEQELGFDWLVL